MNIQETVNASNNIWMDLNLHLSTAFGLAFVARGSETYNDVDKAEKIGVQSRWYGKGIAPFGLNRKSFCAKDFLSPSRVVQSYP